MTTYTRRFWGTRRRVARKYPLYKSVASTAYGNFRAAATNRDQSNVVLQGIISVPVKVTPASTATEFKYSASNGDAIGVSIWQALMSTQYFSYYKSMYDQVKLNGFRCKVIGNSASTLTLASGLSTVGTVIAVDRSGVDGYLSTDIEKPKDTDQNAWVRYMPYIVPTSNNPQVTEEGYERVSRILSYGSAKSKPWSPGNAYTQYVSAYARTAQEKQEWISTDKLFLSRMKHNAGASSAKGILYGFPCGVSNNGQPNDQHHIYTNDYIVYPYGNGRQCNWDPVVLVGVYNVALGDKDEVGVEQLFSFTLEFKVDVSFRGTRNGGLVKGPSNDVSTGEKMDTLVQTIPAGTTQSFTPALGYVWNQATITAGDPPQAGTIGINDANELLPGTTDVIPAATPNMFILEGNNVIKTIGPFPASPSFQNLSVRVKGSEYFPPLLLDITRNGTFTAESSFSGYTLNVNVPSTPTRIELTDFVYNNVTVPISGFTYHTSDRLEVQAQSIVFYVKISGPRYLVTVYEYEYTHTSSFMIPPFYYYVLENTPLTESIFLIKSGNLNVLRSDITQEDTIGTVDMEPLELFRSVFVINFPN